jgi:hypothetical protein
VSEKRRLVWLLLASLVLMAFTSLLADAHLRHGRGWLLLFTLLALMIDMVAFTLLVVMLSCCRRRAASRPTETP